MKLLSLSMVGVLAISAGAAYARPMTKMEWMDPKSIAIWQSLNEKDKYQSVIAKIDEQQEMYRNLNIKNNYFILSDTEIKDIAKKAQGCIQREVEAPDLKNEDFPLSGIEIFCTQKYVSILNSHKMKDRIANNNQKASEQPPSPNK